ncbi:GNAT family N-acetyltransferase [Streptomyces fenghuangensis]|uniref:GNAT family N-acetyltransferase n=1 Tax=Streptomyces chitinivorans TaxID=1257027 RepID=A0ABW7I0Z1_9ACTN|nr:MULTISPECIES: GNAT family N-acetyltransferase [Streptomyces]MCG3042905.1 GNAT family N-acetyltransferase [Streptomyces sp. ICN903]MDH2412249.1 GNAT family N-acetyltransferase [Streptomyces chitinivorans]
MDALADPVAAMAFLERHEEAIAYPDSVWQRRAADGEGRGDRLTLIGETGGGLWCGKLTVLVEGDRTQLVGVYMKPEHRGTGLAAQLFEAAVEWSWARPAVEGVRLYVHEDNRRAEAFYRRRGFRRTGRIDTDPRASAFTAHEMELPRPRL